MTIEAEFSFSAIWAGIYFKGTAGGHVCEEVRCGGEPDFFPVVAAEPETGSGDHSWCGQPARSLAGEGGPQAGLGSGGRSAAQARARLRSGASPAVPGVYAASRSKEEEWCCGPLGCGLWSVSQPKAW
ncbi:hypothetical protein NDU88_003959 [Pleurodeles waltl]|uniref:Uncharacterized protein n=1 Tax=Pleurodeles waltl TaxID=8319 RepID=A0AAV7LGR0_PLEWA|nr:hypothetical protein NDU88_003959 [Pleurodeles waltl]